MIYIRETVPLKYSGLSSFLVTSTEFNPDLKTAMDSVTQQYYSKKYKHWEVPQECLAETLDALTFIDNIQLIMLPPEDVLPKQEGFELTETEISSFHFTPFEHQVEAINYGLNPDHKKWLLLDSMGLGKTLEIIGLAEALHMRGLIDHCMIICGVDSLRQNWKSEIQKFSNLSVQILGEYFTKTGKFRYKTVKERIEILKQPISEFFVIINAATLRDEDIIKALTAKKSPNKFGMIAVDEAHRFTSDSKQGNHLLDLDAEYKVAATGTLLVNSPISCYLPLS